MHNHSYHQHKGDSEEASRRIGWAFFLNVSFTIIEFIGGWLTNSTAIMADAVHDLGDSVSIGAAWGLNKLSGKSANNTFSYGYQRFSLLGALINGLVLTVGSVWILSEAIPRLTAPEMPQVEGMLLLSIFGVAVNGYAAYKVSEGESLNERVLNWHLLEDVLGWVAVLIVSVVLMFIDWPVLDPLLSIGFTLFILFNVGKTLKETSLLFLQATPDEKQLEVLKQNFKALDLVSDIHHLHVWSLDGEKHVLTAHLVLVEGADLRDIKTLKADFFKCLSGYSFEHTTIEFEFADELCRDDAE